CLPAFQLAAKRNGRLIHGGTLTQGGRDEDADRPSPEQNGAVTLAKSGKASEEILLDPSNLSPRIVDGTEDNKRTTSSPRRGCCDNDPTGAWTSAADTWHVSTAQLAANAEETRGQFGRLDQQVLNLGREVADLGQVMKRMAWLMETLVSPAPQITPEHRPEPPAGDNLRPPDTNPPPHYPFPPSLWTKPPLDLHPRPAFLQTQAPPIITASSSPETYKNEGGLSNSIGSRRRSPPPQDGSDASPHANWGQGPLEDARKDSRPHQNQNKTL
ncbi:uncharacterized protein LOC144215207, partial [Stigmatopora nigra]